MNGGAQLGAVTWPYIYKVEYNHEKYGSFIGPVQRAPLRGVWGYAPPEKFLILDFLRWFLMHF